MINKRVHLKKRVSCSRITGAYEKKIKYYQPIRVSSRTTGAKERKRKYYEPIKVSC